MHVNPWPGENSIIVMDNASWHNRNIIENFCDFYGVLVLYLPSYSPILNLTEYQFNGLKEKLKSIPLPENRQKVKLTIINSLEELKWTDNRKLLKELGYLNNDTIE